VTGSDSRCANVLLQYLRYSGQSSSSSWGTATSVLNWTPISATPTAGLSDVVTLNASDWQAGHSYTCSASVPCIVGPLLHNTGNSNQPSGGGGYNYIATSNCTSSGTEPNPWNQ